MCSYLWINYYNNWNQLAIQQTASLKGCDTTVSAEIWTWILDFRSPSHCWLSDAAYSFFSNQRSFLRSGPFLFFFFLKNRCGWIARTDPRIIKAIRTLELVIPLPYILVLVLATVSCTRVAVCIQQTTGEEEEQTEHIVWSVCVYNAVPVLRRVCDKGENAFLEGHDL